MFSKKHLIVTKHEGIAEYVRTYIIGTNNIEEHNLEVEVVWRIDDPEKQLKGKHVYCLPKLDWGRFALSITTIKIDLDKLGKPLREASGHEIARTKPEKWRHVVSAEKIEDPEIEHKEEKAQRGRPPKERPARPSRADLPPRPPANHKKDQYAHAL